MSVSVSTTTNTVTVTQPRTQVVRVVTAGPRGPQGIQGPAGSGDGSQEGTQGITGAQGIQGVTGLQGIQGITGIEGIQGTTGAQGTIGSQGIQGIQGITGIEGIQGTTGAQGISGELIGSESFATTGSNTFTDNQTIQGTVSASYFDGDGRYLDNLPGTTNWNYNQEFEVKNTEQLTFSGDYILENTYLTIQGGQPASIGEWTPIIFTEGRLGSVTQTSNNQYTLITPHEGTYAGDGVQIKRFFDTETTMSVQYVWNGEDVGNDRPYYEVGTQDPTEPNNMSRLRNTSATSESGTWIINVPSGSWVAIGVWTDNNNSTTGSLQITLPYLPNEDIVQYSSNKYFKKEGKIFIGGNLLVKDSYIENNGQISVGGEVVLIGNSQIVGTGTII